MSISSLLPCVCLYVHFFSTKRIILSYYDVLTTNCSTFPLDDEVEYDDTDNDTAIVIYPYRALNPDEVCLPNVLLNAIPTSYVEE